MINQIRLLNNIGQFDHVSPHPDTSLAPFSIIYGENGQGKTTIAAILRSVSTNDPNLVMERHRLGSNETPHIVFDYEGTPTVFENGTWSRNHPNITVFDDAFVSDNIYSGVEVNSNHRYGLHELIIGSQGIALNETLQKHVQNVEMHNSRLRELSNAISPSVRGSYSVDDFCNLEKNDNIDSEIQNTENRLSAAKSAEQICNNPNFEEIMLPDFDVDELEGVLSRVLSDLDTEAVNRVRKHISRIGEEGEEWISSGTQRIDTVSKDLDKEVCPYCTQNLSGSEIIKHYRSYFSEEYENLKETIVITGKSVRNTHGDENPTNFERNIHLAEQTREFWKKFTEVPKIDIDTKSIVTLWKRASDAVLNQLRAKVVAPLEKMKLTPETLLFIEDYRTKINEVRALSQRLKEANIQINEIKQQVQTDNLVLLKNTLANLNTQKIRFSSPVIRDCEAYIQEKIAKNQTVEQREIAKTELNKYQNEIFTKYENSINEFLTTFLASFSLGKVNSKFSRGGASVSYEIVINKESVPIDNDTGASFRNTLSSGDRNTLALAFFFASLELEPDSKDKIVIFDDPMTSLDEYRTFRTCEEIIKLSKTVKQVIVLSHSKSFLCNIWEEVISTTTATPLLVKRAAEGSELVLWNVRNDLLTEHDKRHERIRDYIRVATPENERQVATDLRPTLERFLRVAYPEHFPPESTLGEFINKCRTQEILSSDDIEELDKLRKYSNQFHHDTERNMQNIHISDIELKNFAERTILFTSRR